MQLVNMSSPNKHGWSHTPSSAHLCDAEMEELMCEGLTGLLSFFSPHTYPLRVETRPK
jgi:hypothetical protein